MEFDPTSKPASLLSEKRHVDRMEMLQALNELCSQYGIAASLTLNFHGNKRAVAITIEGPHKLTATIDFSGDSGQPDVYVINWHINDLSREKRMIIHPMFCASINQFHRRKATDVCRGFPELYGTIESRLKKMVTGLATMPDDRENPKTIPRPYAKEIH